MAVVSRSEEIQLSIERHATSKLSVPDDLFKIETLGSG